MQGQHTLNTSQYITNIIKATLDYHEHFRTIYPQLASMYGKAKFRDECQTIKLSLPRGFGHTTAALSILDEYSNSIIIVNHRANGMPSEGIFVIEDIRDGSCDFDILAVISNIRDGLDFVIADDVKLTAEDKEKIFKLFNPRLLILLGGIAC